MAKKDPTDLTVEEKLKTLYQLQVTLSGIDQNRELRGELPLEVEDLEDEIAGLTTRIENIQREMEQFGLIIPPVAFPLRRHGHIGHSRQLRQQAALPHRFRQHPAKKRQAFPHALKFQLLHPGAKGPLIPGAP